MKAKAMATDHRAELARIHRFDQLIRYLRDEMGWPIASDDFEELTFDYTAEELGINAESAAKIQEIKRLRPLSAQQPWGIFFVKFEPKNLPVVALRRILSQVALKKRASANAADRAGWAADDLLFVSNYGQDGERKISFAHFARPSGREDLPTLKVLGWDNQDTPLHLDAIAKELTENLAWPQNENDVDSWRRRWRSAFTLGHREVVTTAERLSIRLAELAGAIRDRIRSAIAIESPRGPLTRLMKAFQESLVHDLDAESFSDMYAQTISYGLLSSRIADPSKKTADDFAAHMRTSPFLRELMQTFLKAGGRKGRSDGAGIDFDELGVADVVELLDGANMEAVLRDFGDRNRQEDPVIHFFEGFLQAYDRRIRKDRGVFYTPQPVVSYIVRSVHELLQNEFGLADGLADTTTWGEMLKKHSSLKLPLLTDEPGETRTISPGEPFVQILDPATGTATFLVEVIDVIHRTLSAKWRQQRLTHDQQLDAWNDYVPKHLLPRLHAFELMMAPYAIAHMKIGLKLAETGYRFETDERARVYLTNALEPCVKQLPLIGFDALAHEAAAVNDIKRHKRFTVVIGNPPYSVNSTNDILFMRELMDDYKQIEGVPLGEVRIAPLMDDYCKFIRFSDHLIYGSACGVIGMITNHGFLTGPVFRGMRHSLKSRYSVSIFDLHGNYFRGDPALGDTNVFDIKPGVCISVLSRPPRLPSPRLTYSEIRGPYETKLRLLAGNDPLLSDEVMPLPPLFVWTRALSGNEEYFSFPSVTEMFSVGTLGMMTGKDHFMISWSKAEMSERISHLSDRHLTDQLLREKYALEDSRDWVLKRARSAGFDPGLVVPVNYRPFDIRWTYYHKDCHASPQRRVNDPMIAVRNLALCVPRQLASLPFEHCFVTSHVTEMSLISNKTKEANRVFPLYAGNDSDSLLQAGLNSNITPGFLDRIASALGGRQPSLLTPEDIFHYSYAVFQSPGYRSRYAEFLKIDFPRLPLTGNLELFRALTHLGSQLTALHLLESPLLDQPITEFIGIRNPEVEKVSWTRDTVFVDKAQTIGFRGVSEKVWHFHIGCYQVCQKWLKDRKGRKLSKEDIAHYQKVIVALTETIRLMVKIDEVIEQHGGWPDAFSKI